MVSANGSSLGTTDQFVETTICIQNSISFTNFRFHVLTTDSNFEQKNILGYNLFKQVIDQGINIFDYTDNAKPKPAPRLLYASEETIIEANTSESVEAERSSHVIESKYILIRGPDLKPNSPLFIPDGIAQAEAPRILIGNQSDHDIVIRKGETIAAFAWAGDTISEDNNHLDRLRLITHVSEISQPRKDEILNKIKTWKAKRKAKLEKFHVTEEQLEIGEIAEETKEALLAVLNTRKGAFAIDKGEQGMTHYEYTIEFKPNEENKVVRPKLSDFCLKNYRHNLIQSQYIDEDIEKLLAAGTISYTSSAANLPTVMVVKRLNNGKVKTRLCVNFTKLNHHVQIRNWSVPNCPEIMDRLSQSIAESKKKNQTVYFLTTDICKAFQSIHLDPVSRMYCAFSHRDKSYAFDFLPFGLSSSPAAFTETISRILVDILNKYKKNLAVYIDDIIAWSPDKKLLLKILDELLERLESENVLLNLEKSSFFVQEVNFLGKIINNDGIRPTEKSLDTIINFDRPKTLKNTQKLLGHANFLLDHLPRFKIVAQPLYDLISRLILDDVLPTKVIQLSEKENKAWDDVINLANSAIQIEHLDYFGKLYLVADACQSHVGYCLGNEYIDETGAERHTVCKVGSFKMHPSLLNSCSKIHEAFGLLNSLKLLRRELQGTELTLYSDNKAAVNLIKEGEFNSAAVPRALKYLFPFTQCINLTVKYITAKSNLISFSDAISRNVIRVETIRTINAETQINWQHSFNWNILIEGQKHDELCQHLHKKLAREGFAKISGKDVAKTNDTLYVIKQDIPMVIIPEKFIYKLLRAIHNGSIHGSEATMARIIQREQLFIPQQNQRIRELVSSCLTCQLHSRVACPSKQFSFNLKPTIAFSQIHVDLFTLTNVNVNQYSYRYVLLAIDSFSQHLCAYLLETKTSTEVSKHIRSYCMQLNINNATFASDNGREFDNIDLKNTLRNFCCSHMRTAAMNPTANNLVERCVGETKRRLRKLGTSETTMSENLELVVYTHNNTPIGTKLNRTPFELAFGRPNLQLLGKDDDDIRINASEYEEQYSKLQYEVASHVTKTMIEQLFTTTYKDGKFKRLDFCLVLAPSKPNFLGKTGLSYIGPCIITKLFGRNGYIAKCIYSGQTYRRNGKYIKLLNLSNELKRDIKGQLMNMQISSIDADSLREIIDTKLNEKNNLDKEIQKEIATLIDPEKRYEKGDIQDAEPKGGKNLVATAPTPQPEDKTQNSQNTRNNHYNLREKRKIKYSA